MSEPKPALRPEFYVLKPSRVHQGEAKIRYWYATPEAGTPYSALFKPEYWSTNRHLFEIGDMIRIEPDEGHYTADLKVLSIGVGGVRVAEYYKKDWEKAEAPAGLLVEYVVKWAGPHHKFRVERRSDNNVEATGFASESDANRWLADNGEALMRARAKAA